jgi:hypothetical protein
MRVTVVVLGLVTAAAIAVGVGMTRHSQAFPPNEPVIAPVETVTIDVTEQCVVAVMGLLARAEQAVQQGSTQGLDMDQLAARWGTQSAVFQTFAATQAVLIGDVVQHGPDGALTRIQPEVQARCAELA